VLIASSTDTHAGHLRRAADAGVAVLCEKPIDLNLARATEAVAYAAARSARAMVAFNRRFDRDYAELKRVVDGGGIGQVELIQLTSRGPAMPPLDYIRVSGGQMRDQAVHFFDLARWIGGLDPVEVFAAGSALADPRIAEYGDVDTSAVTLRLPTGALVQIDRTRRTGYGYDERIEVLGSAGLVEARRHRAGALAPLHRRQGHRRRPAPQVARTRPADLRRHPRPLRHRTGQRPGPQPLPRRRPAGPGDRRGRHPVPGQRQERAHRLPATFGLTPAAACAGGSPAQLVVDPADHDPQNPEPDGYPDEQAHRVIGDHNPRCAQASA
jgi:predicted dehydrogenase